MLMIMPSMRQWMDSVRCAAVAIAEILIVLTNASLTLHNRKILAVNFQLLYCFFCFCVFFLIEFFYNSTNFLIKYDDSVLLFEALEYGLHSFYFLISL
jgi:hypothetical protein